MIVFITGASSGFGAEMARTFVKHGHQVVLAARRQQRLAALAAELGDSALALEMDVTDKDAINDALALLPQSWRQIDVLTGKIRDGNLTLVPLSLYFTDGKVKVELALARGKQAHDKRQDIARRDAQRDVIRELGRRTKGKI